MKGLVQVLTTLDPSLGPTEALRAARQDPELRAFVEAERRRLARMSRHEGLRLTPGEEIVAGADEVGRGPIAGPLVAAAVAFRRLPWIPGLRDSKKLQPEEREAMVPWIRAQAESWAVQEVSVDDLNGPMGTIHSHSLEAMHRCLRRLEPRPHRVLVDGKFMIAGLDVPQKAVVRGDDCCVTVAAASVLAKVHRDRLMMDLDGLWPGYGLARHKGYCTAEHLEALEKLGPCDIHRTRFVRIRELRGDLPVQGLLDFDD